MKKVLYESRIKKLIEVLKEKEISGFIFTLSDNMYYFTNYYDVQRERLLIFFVPTVGDPFFLVPELHYDQILEVTSIDNIISWADEENPFEKMASIIKKRKLSTSKIAIDDTLRGDFLLALQERLPQVKFVSGSKFVSVLRQVKSNDEKDLMLHLGSIHDEVIKEAISKIQVGVSELEIANLIEDTFKKYGAKSASLTSPIVASGPYSAQPHYSATEKLIKDGESIVLDFSGIYQHYRSDMTRTVFTGKKPTEEYLKIYNIVKKAQEEGVQSVKPGRTCEEIDRIVRKIIEDEGYGQYFIHRTGHGIGLDVHEEPYIVEGNKLLLEPGMTFSIEPGIYLPGKYGVRIEDCVIVTEEGAEPFTKFTHDLIMI